MLLLLVMGGVLSGDGRRQWRACACAETWSERFAALLYADATAIAVCLCLLGNAEPPCDPLFFELGVELREWRGGRAVTSAYTYTVLAS